MFFITSPLSQEFPSYLEFTQPTLTNLLELLIHLDFFVNCMKLWEQVGFECLMSLIIYASCEKKIDPKHPGEANPCRLCDQLRHKLNVRNEWK